MSTFIKTPGWIKNKNCTINPQNNDNNVFNTLLHFLYTITKSKRIIIESERLNHLLTVLIGKILIFHQHNRIMNNLK